MTGAKPTSAATLAARRERLEIGCARLGIELPARACARLMTYLDELARWNATYNLTAVREPDDMVVRHLLDSLGIVPFLPAGALIDVGSGAGLPGVPLALIDSGCAVTVLESNGKKATFLRHVRRTLAIENLDVAQSRAERYRPSAAFSGVLTRAFSALPEMLRMTGHLAAPDGRWLAMKGRLPAPELARLPAGYRVLETHRLDIPFLDEARHLIVVARADE